ncbi:MULTISPECIES: MFS transporter [unclassified Cryobacterium]|uniref:MFS transporter n=1 Tax=unclassified Cryobacterium TaxID=2649013 RepID=UPI002AB55461|nr:MULTISPECIES: MFS transporter [unclassified Cryobacterium]MDY7541669.1 MFS transporter [Cryobacterium sp. 5B3]MEB0267237.1 MFS transporter [Cryobacterium sp. 10I5]MEB0275880.1 MFS transporter [Cryobacterium sp. 5B3]
MSRVTALTEHGTPAATDVHGRPEGGGSILHQPTAVWAVAFACVIAFMGIGLVDPILPAIARDLAASPTQTEMLFTSYLVITGIAMFFTSWLSSRIGAKRTLLIGLALIIVFALAAGLSQNVETIIGFRAGWGLGNALFISTALATIVGAASGGTSSAIILYEAALGLGIAIGPLIGGLLGSISWRGPFFGSAALMAIGFVAIIVMLKKEPQKPAPIRLSAPFRALARPGLGILASAALFYNIGFFVLLAYTPFALVPLGLGSAITLGLVFFGWGISLAVTSVWVAPLLTRRMRRSRVLWLVLPLLALDLAAAGLFIGSAAGVVTCVIVGGLLLGVLNTVLTESVMEATDLPRPVASSAYSGVRFLGGAIAPPAATLLAEFFGPAVPFYAGAASVLVACAILVIGHRHLARADGAMEDEFEEAEAIGAGDS